MRIVSIVIYFFIFLISFLVFSVAERTQNEKNKIIHLLLGVLILSVFAGVRNVSVGFDTERTLSFYFYPSAQVSSISAAANLYTTNDPFYRVLSFLISRISKSSFIFLFAMQLITSGSVAIVAYRERDKASISACMLMYMLMFYLISFNIIRQSAAAAVLLLAIVEYKNKRIKRTVVCAVLACLLHNSGIIGVALLIIAIVLSHSERVMYKIIALTIGIAGFTFVMIYWDSLARWIIGEGYVSGHYIGYVNIFSGGASAYSSKYVTMTSRTYLLEGLRGIEFILLLLCLSTARRSLQNYKMLFVYSVILSFAIYSWFVFGFHSYLGDRITIFYDYVKILCFGYLLKIEPINYSAVNKNRFVIGIKTGIPLILGIYYIVYFFDLFMIHGYGGVIPYIL